MAAKSATDGVSLFSFSFATRDRHRASKMTGNQIRVTKDLFNVKKFYARDYYERNGGAALHRFFGQLTEPSVAPRSSFISEADHVPQHFPCPARHVKRHRQNRPRRLRPTALVKMVVLFSRESGNRF
jgi:hypothetical protein